MSKVMSYPYGHIPSHLLSPPDPDALRDDLNGYRVINLYRATVTSAFITFLANISSISWPERLNLGGLAPSSKTEENNKLIKLLGGGFLESFTDLKHLNLSQAGWLFKKDVHWLESLLSRNRQLESLNLNACSLGDSRLSQVLDVLVTSRACDRMHTLKLGDNELTKADFDRLLDFARSHPSLTTCFVENNRLTKAQESALSGALEQNKRLNKKLQEAQQQWKTARSTASDMMLDISGCSGFHWRIQHILKNLGSVHHYRFSGSIQSVGLRCQHAELTDAQLCYVLEQFSGLPFSQRLTQLDLRHNPLSNKGLEYLTAFAQRSFFFTTCELDAGLRHLTGFPHLEAVLAENRRTMALIKAIDAKDEITVQSELDDEALLFSLAARLNLSSERAFPILFYSLIGHMTDRLGDLLLKASAEGNISTVKRIIAACPDALYKRPGNRWNENALTVAIRHTQAEAVAYFLPTKLWGPPIQYLSYAKEKAGPKARKIYLALRKQRVEDLVAAIRANRESDVDSMLDDNCLAPTQAELQAWLTLAIHTANPKLIQHMLVSRMPCKEGESAEDYQARVRSAPKADIFAIGQFFTLAPAQRKNLDTMRLDHLKGLCTWGGETSERLSALLKKPFVQAIFHRNPEAIKQLVEATYHYRHEADYTLEVLQTWLPDFHGKIQTHAIERIRSKIDEQIQNKYDIDERLLSGKTGNMVLARYGRQWLQEAQRLGQAHYGAKATIIKQLKELLHKTDAHHVVASLSEMDVVFQAKVPHKSVKAPANPIHKTLATSTSAQAGRMSPERRQTRHRPSINLVDCRLSFIVSDRPHAPGGEHSRRLITVALPVDPKLIHIEDKHKDMHRADGGPRSRTLLEEVKMTFPENRHAEIDGAFATTEPSSKTAFHRRFHCSERTIYAYLQDQALLDAIVDQAVAQIGDGDLSGLKFYQLVVDMHSTRMLCQDCRDSTLYAYHPQSEFAEKLIQAIQAAGHKIQTKSGTIGVMTRVSSTRQPATTPRQASSAPFRLFHHRATHQSTVLEYCDPALAKPTHPLAINLSASTRNRAGIKP